MKNKEERNTETNFWYTELNRLGTDRLKVVPQKCLRLYEVQRKIHVSRACLKPLISTGKSNGVKIPIWSKSLGTRLLRTTGFIKIPYRPKIQVLSLIDKSLR